MAVVFNIPSELPENLAEGTVMSNPVSDVFSESELYDTNSEIKIFEKVEKP